MKIFKIISALILCTALIVISGCGKIEANKTVPKVEEPQKTSEGSQKQPETSSSENVSSQQPSEKLEEGVEITDSDSIYGWKTLTAVVSLMRLGEGNSYKAPSADDTDKDKLLKYSIDFPGRWTLDYTVFHDDDGKKVAEIPPAVLLKPGQEAEFLDYKPMTDFGEELISKEEIQTNSYKGTKTMTKIPTDAGSWCPIIYRISDGTYGYTIIFYTNEKNKVDWELFDRIVNTFRIEQ